MTVKGVDATISELQKKAAKIQAVIDEMRQWKTVLAEQLERERRVALMELPTLPMENDGNVEDKKDVPTMQQEELAPEREEQALAPQVVERVDLEVMIEKQRREQEERDGRIRATVPSPLLSPFLDASLRGGRDKEEEDSLELLPSVPKRRRRSKMQGFRQACEVCGLHAMDTVEKLRAHLKTHIKMGSRTCPIPTCNQALKSAAGLSRHLLLSHHRLEQDSQAALFPDVKFVIPPRVILECFHCDAQFGDADELDMHIRKHMGQKYPRECNLEECRFLASTQDDMARHVIVSHYQLQAECSACGLVCQDDHECSIRSEDVIDKRVTVRWLRDKEIAWYEGTVKQYVPAMDSFEILYDDGTRVIESLSMRYWRTLAPVSN